MRERLRQALTDAVAPYLADGEEVSAVGGCWAVRAREGPLFFAKRRRYLVALTQHRMLLVRRRARVSRLSSRDLALARPFASLNVARTRPFGVLSQLVLTGEGDYRLVLEFPPAERALGRRIAGRVTRASEAHA
jgi:hypothetical protein